MSKTPNIGLHATSTTEDKRFLDWRDEISGERSDSNTMILDSEIGALKTSLSTHTQNSGIHISSGKKSAPIDADSIAIIDSTDGQTAKQLSWEDMKQALGSTFVTTEKFASASVNGKTADEAGNIQLTAEDVGGLSAEQINTALSNKANIINGPVDGKPITLNNAIAPGYYGVNLPSNAEGLPPWYAGDGTSYFYGLLIVECAGDWIWQTLHWTGGGNPMVRRRINQDPWTLWEKTPIAADLSKKVSRASELVPLGTNVLTLAPGRYMVDGLTTEAAAMHLPITAWHYEIDVLASENVTGLINNHKVIIAYPISTGDQYTNTMDYSGNWTGWMKTPTSADLSNKANVDWVKGLTQLPGINGGTILAAIAEHIANNIYRGNFFALNCTDMPTGEQSWAYNISFYLGEYPVVMAYRSFGGYINSGLYVRMITVVNGSWAWSGDWTPLATATLSEKHDLPLSEGITAYRPCKFSKDQFGHVLVNISLSPANGILQNPLVAVLPPEYRAAHYAVASAVALTPQGRIAASLDVTPAGEIFLYADSQEITLAAGTIVFDT